MLVKTFKGGRTYAGAVAMLSYLLNGRVEAGLAKVIKGDSELTKSIIHEASKYFKWSWSTGVLSFSELLNRDIIDDIIVDFERTFFAGLDPCQYNILWVLHIDKGRTELHYVSARMELSEGKSYNLYYVHRDFRKKDIFQEYINQCWELTSYLDKQALTSKLDPKWSKNEKRLVRQIDEALLPLIEDGSIESRDDVVEKLRVWGFELVDIGKKSLSIITNDGEVHQMKGAIYGEKFRHGSNLLKGYMKRNAPTIGIKTDGIEREQTRNERKLEISLNEIIRKQTYSNQKKHPIPTPVRKAATRVETKSKQEKEEEYNDKLSASIARYDRERNKRAGRRKNRAGRRKGRVERLIEFNIWSKSTDTKYVTEGFEQWIRDRRLRENFEQAVQTIFGNFGRIKQKLAERNKEALGLLRLKRVKTNVNNTFKMRM